MSYSYIYNAATGQPEFVGLSKDEKPLHDARLHNGMPLIEMDTSTIYFFDSENRKWWPFSTAGGGSGGGSAADIIPEGGLQGQYLTNDGEDNLEWADLPEINHVVGTLTRIDNITQGPEGAVIDSGELHIAIYDGISVGSTYKEGDVFYVTCDKPCAVGISHNDGETFVELEAHKTDTENKYAFTLPLLHERFVIGIILRGDANGDGKVSAADATRIIRYLNKYDSNSDLDGMQYLAADADMNGAVDRNDATRIQRYLAGADFVTNNKIDWNVRDVVVKEAFDGRTIDASLLRYAALDDNGNTVSVPFSALSDGVFSYQSADLESFARIGASYVSDALYNMTWSLINAMYDEAAANGIASLNFYTTLEDAEKAGAANITVRVAMHPASIYGAGISIVSETAINANHGAPSQTYTVVGSSYNPGSDGSGDYEAAVPYYGATLQFSCVQRDYVCDLTLYLVASSEYGWDQDPQLDAAVATLRSRKFR